jgi:hypothetical protein
VKEKKGIPNNNKPMEFMSIENYTLDIDKYIEKKAISDAAGLLTSSVRQVAYSYGPNEEIDIDNLLQEIKEE